MGPLCESVRFPRDRSSGNASGRQVKDDSRGSLQVIDGGKRADGPRSVHLREASKGMASLDLDDSRRTRGLGDDGRWLWHALGALLLERGYLTTADGSAFAMLCKLYELRGTSDGFEVEFLEGLALFDVTPQLLRDLEAAR